MTEQFVDFRDVTLVSLAQKQIQVGLTHTVEISAESGDGDIVATTNGVLTEQNKTLEQNTGRLNLGALRFVTPLSGVTFRLNCSDNSIWAPQQLALLGAAPAATPWRLLAISGDLDTARKSDGPWALVPLVSGDGEMAIKELVFILFTSAEVDLVAESRLELLIEKKMGFGFQFSLPPTALDAGQNGMTHFCRFVPNLPLKPEELGSVRLSVSGPGRWLLEHLFLFGLDHSSNAPRKMVPLVCETSREAKRWMCCDPQHGRASIELDFIRY